jgi:hypothetical protein
MLTVANHKQHQNISTPMLRLVLYKGEVYRLPATSHGIRVLSGVAWVTVTGKDRILLMDEQTSLSLNNDFALVSALDRTPLVLEVWGDNKLHSAHVK